MFCGAVRKASRGFPDAHLVSAKLWDNTFREIVGGVSLTGHAIPATPSPLLKSKGERGLSF